MKIDEFKAWFEGFTESMDGEPTAKQWKRIKAQVAAIDGHPVTYPVYVDRYLPRIRPYWEATIATYSATAQSANEFNSTIAMNAAGRADYLDSVQ